VKQHIKEMLKQNQFHVLKIRRKLNKNKNILIRTFLDLFCVFCFDVKDQGFKINLHTNIN
jgi:hypothetical protein